jgi:hypothetical protein
LIPVVSARKAAASRINGAKGGGPRTAAGRARSSRNAFRHGLATISYRNSRCAKEIEEIVDRICGNRKDPFFRDQVIVFAESEYLLRCISTERIAVIERLRDRTRQPLVRGDNSMALAKARLKRFELAYAELVKLRPSVAEKGLYDGYFGDETAAPSGAPKPNPAQILGAGVNQALTESDPLVDVTADERTELEAFILAMPDLARLERYERRAWSRRKRALREITAWTVP